jgi:hypothetical protein
MVNKVQISCFLLILNKWDLKTTRRELPFVIGLSAFALYKRSFIPPGTKYKIKSHTCMLLHEWLVICSSPFAKKRAFLSN